MIHPSVRLYSVSGKTEYNQMIDRQTPRNQTLYADLLQEVLSATSPSGRGLSFTRKTIKGRIYWYLSVAVGNRQIGRASWRERV